MSIVRFIIFGLLAWVAYVVIKSFIRRVKVANIPPPPVKKTVVAKIVRCTECGVHVPEQEAVLGEQGRYLCREHVIKS